jgi:hypothetical protein
MRQEAGGNNHTGTSDWLLGSFFHSSYIFCCQLCYTEWEFCSPYFTFVLGETGGLGACSPHLDMLLTFSNLDSLLGLGTYLLLKTKQGFTNY